MMRPEVSAGAQQTGNEDLPWYMKYGVRLVGGISALAALILGAMACITVTPKCLLAGISQMLFGVLVALIEAPFLCMFLDFAQIPSAYFDGKPPWMRGLLYIVIAIIPISLCASFSTILGSGLIFVTGSLYGMTSLKRNKAPMQDMQVKASSSYNLLQSAGEPGKGTIQPQQPSGGVIINVVK